MIVVHSNDHLFCSGTERARVRERKRVRKTSSVSDHSDIVDGRVHGDAQIPIKRMHCTPGDSAALTRIFCY